MKILAAIHPDIAALIPKHPNELVFVKTPVSHGIHFTKDVDFIIPYQKNGVVDKKTATVLNTVKPTGWDWLPESLRFMQQSLIVWCLSPYHRSEEVKADLAKHGFKFEDKAISPELFQEFMKHQQPIKVEEPNHSSLYERTRFLWANHHEKFSAWENSFVLNVGQSLKNNRPLSKAQTDSLLKLFHKYRVPTDATASIQAF